MPRRLAKPLYESLPLLWALAGLACLVVSWWQGKAAWSGVVALAGLGLLVVAIAVWLHRRDYRATSAEYVRRGQPVPGREEPPPGSQR
jgi:Zn-dependent protease with chaperone function